MNWNGLVLAALAASALAQAAASQNAGGDPCRFSTAAATGSAFGRQMKSTKLFDTCEYLSTRNERVMVQVKAGPEGTILRHARSTVQQKQAGVEKLATSVGEAYFDSTLALFIGRAGTYDVQIETTIQPTPRATMIAFGTRIMESLARK